MLNFVTLYSTQIASFMLITVLCCSETLRYPQLFKLVSYTGNVAYYFLKKFIVFVFEENVNCSWKSDNRVPYA